MRLEYFYALGVVLLCLAAYWFLRETDDPARPVDSITGEFIKPPPPTRRDELIRARNDIRRQMEILQSPVRGKARNEPYLEYQLAELDAMLDEINAELSEPR